MNQLELNDLPEKVASGKISRSAAVHQLAIYLQSNYGIFGLNKKDDDFRSEVVLLFLERGEKIFDQFDPNYGSFFTYFFCFIKSLMNSETRKRASQTIQEYHSVSESISNYEQELDAYKTINFKEIDAKKVPYAYKQVSADALQLACKTDSYHIKDFLKEPDDDFSQLQDNLKKISPSMAERILLVLALKSAYYITDKQIKKISEICHIDENNFHSVVLDLKNQLNFREENKIELEIRRNKAYYQHRKYGSQMEWTQEKKDISDYEKLILENKYKKQTINWQKLNKQLEKGIINIRPTNKAVAKALGLCERQISFYIKNAYILGLSI